MNRSRFPSATRHRQRGVVMLFGLLALGLMLIAAAAMVRSMNTSMVTAGNLGFKRDMANQVERALVRVNASLMGAGPLATESARQADSITHNYSADLLPTNEQGIPTALLTTNDTTFSAVGSTSNDIEVADQQIRIRYLIDRVCANTGAAAATHCTMAADPVPKGGGGSNSISAERSSAAGAGALTQRVVYRLTVRVTGPRDTQAFFQSTMTL